MAGSWSFEHCSLTLNGVLITGFDDAGTVEFAEQASNTPTTGADGRLTVSKNADSHVTVGITLKQTSPSIKYLNTLHAASQVSPVAVPNALAFNDLGNGTVYAGPAYFLGMEAYTFGKEAGSLKFNLVLERGRDSKILNALSFG